jgi:hypothetical protein
VVSCLSEVSPSAVVPCSFEVSSSAAVSSLSEVSSSSEVSCFPSPRRAPPDRCAVARTAPQKPHLCCAARDVGELRSLGVRPVTSPLALSTHLNRLRLSRS